MSNPQQDNQQNTDSLHSRAADTAARAKRQLKGLALRSKAVAATCGRKVFSAAAVCKDKLGAAAGACKAKAAPIAHQAAAGLDAVMAVWADKVALLFAKCEAKLCAAYQVCKAKISPVVAKCKEKVSAAAQVYQAKVAPVLTQCKTKVLAAARVCKAKAAPVVAKGKTKAMAVAGVCKVKAAPVVSKCKTKVGAAAQACKAKAAPVATVCSDTALVACMDTWRNARKGWEKASAWGVEQWDKAGQWASQVRVRVDRHPVSPLLYITLLCVGVGTIAFNGMYTKAYVAYVDGQEVGVVASAEELSSIVGNVETRVASVLGEDYDYDAEITLSPTYVDAGTQTNTRAVEDALFEDTGAMMGAYAISVDGQELGYAQTSQELEQILEQVAAPYITQQTISHRFTQNVAIYPVEVPSNTVFTPEVLLTTLSGNKEEAQYVSVVRGDTFNRIAEAAGITGEQLQSLNPGSDSSRLIVGDQLLVKQAVPMLTVETVVTQVYEETLQSPVEYVDNSSMYEGTTKLKQQGQDGVVQVQAQVTLLNGVEVQRQEVSRTTIQEATTTYMYQGTKKKPSTASTGQLKWPVSGTITSRYGYRDIFGGTSFHTGLDIAAPNGTPIYAADGGKVTFSGYRGNYGYMVVITHDNGMQTYYAHCSSLLVSVGDKVYQRQKIATVGISGRATGHHCHFEVRFGNKTVNPENYL